MFTHILNEMFSWPAGIVVGNLIASFMIWFPHFVWAHRDHRKVYAHITALHEKHDALHEKIDRQQGWEFRGR